MSVREHEALVQAAPNFWIFSVRYLWPWLGDGTDIHYVLLLLEMTSHYPSQAVFSFSHSPGCSNGSVAQPDIYMVALLQTTNNCSVFFLVKV